MTQYTLTCCVCYYMISYRDANFQDAEIVRSEERGSLGPRAGPSGVQEQRHIDGPGEICHCISDVIDQIYRKYCQKNKLTSCLIKITGCYLVFTLEKYERYLLLFKTWRAKVKGLEMNKAYRPNAHLLDTLMHFNINII